MRLFLVKGTGWGMSVDIVRARDEQHAREVANDRSADVIELSPEGDPGVLWSYENSPDSPREAD